MSQEALAAQCRVTRTTIVNVENEHANPSLNLLLFICLALDLELKLVPNEALHENLDKSV